RWPSVRDEFKIESGRRSKGLLLRFGPLPIKYLEIESPLVTPESDRSSAKSVAAPALSPADSSTAPEYLRHSPGNEMHPKVTGAKNLIAISDRVKMRLLSNGRESDSWIA